MWLTFRTRSTVKKRMSVTLGVLFMAPKRTWLILWEQSVVSNNLVQATGQGKERMWITWFTFQARSMAKESLWIIFRAHVHTVAYTQYAVQQVTPDQGTVRHYSLQRLCMKIKRKGCDSCSRQPVTLLIFWAVITKTVLEDTVITKTVLEDTVITKTVHED